MLWEQRFWAVVRAAGECALGGSVGLSALYLFDFAAHGGEEGTVEVIAVGFVLKPACRFGGGEVARSELRRFGIGCSDKGDMGAHIFKQHRAETQIAGGSIVRTADFRRAAVIADVESVEVDAHPLAESEVGGRGSTSSRRP